MVFFFAATLEAAAVAVGCWSVGLSSGGAAAEASADLLVFFLLGTIIGWDSCDFLGCNDFGSGFSVCVCVKEAE